MKKLIFLFLLLPFLTIGQALPPMAGNSGKFVTTDGVISSWSSTTSDLTVTNAPTFTAMTIGSVLYTGTSGLLTQDNARFFWDNTNHRLGIGTATPSTDLHILHNVNAGATMLFDNPSTGTSSFAGITLKSGTVTKGYIYVTPATYDDTSMNNGLVLQNANSGPVIIYTGSGHSVFSTSSNNVIVGSGVLGTTSATARLDVYQPALTSAWLPIFRTHPGAFTGITANTPQYNHHFGAGTKQWATGTLDAQIWNYFDKSTLAFVGTSTATDVYNSYFESTIVGTNATITNNWSAGFNGDIAAGTKLYVGSLNTKPTAYLHLKAGTTSANTAPLKFTSGSLNTSAEAGAVEYLTDSYYATIATGAARKEIVLSDVSLVAGRMPFVGTNGRLANNNAFLYDQTTGLTLGTAGNGIAIKEGTGGMMGQTTLVTGTKAITVSGVTTGTRCFIQLVSPTGVTLTTQYQCVCTSNTVTLQANVAAGTINAADGSTMNYILFNQAP